MISTIEINKLITIVLLIKKKIYKLTNNNKKLFITLLSDGDEDIECTEWGYSVLDKHNHGILLYYMYI